ncbi:MAG: TolC family protein, partial [Opitutales bacterium]|nr:TolC family protein [Opitutales bacterium]
MLQNFPEIKVGQADVRIQETAINTAHSQRLPQLGLSLRGGEERFRNSASRYSLSKIGGFSFDASQLLFDGGSARSRIREAQALNQLSEIELESTRQVLALDLSQT